MEIFGKMPSSNVCAHYFLPLFLMPIKIQIFPRNFLFPMLTNNGKSEGRSWKIKRVSQCTTFSFDASISQKI